MDGAFTVTDPTDWLKTSLTAFSPLETALRCQVCKDFFNNPVITSCFHTFCSLCIRRCLSAEGKCPACRAGDQASKLRRNWAIEEAVATFTQARPEALRLATEAKQRQEEQDSRPIKRRRVDSDSSQPQPETQRRSTRRSTRNTPHPNHNDSPEEAIVVVDDNDAADADYSDGLVSCPLCSARMKEEAVFPHLDRCDGSTGAPPRAQKAAPAAFPRSAALAAAAAAAAHPQERLPELNYSLLADGQMRKRLKELGIPATGAKALMVRRHTEWVNLWNANCDAARPKGKRELLHELDVWERALGGMVRENKEGGVMGKGFDAEGWKRSNKEDFGRLIAEARERGRRKVEKKEEDDKELENGVGDEGSKAVNGISEESAPPKEGEALFAKAVATLHDRGGSPPKRMPMFTVPSQAVADVEMEHGTVGE